jgi:hypothetical protein
VELHSRCGAPLYGSATFVRAAAIHIFESFFVPPLAPPPPGEEGVCSTACCSASPLNPVLWRVRLESLQLGPSLSDAQFKFYVRGTLRVLFCFRVGFGALSRARSKLSRTQMLSRMDIAARRKYAQLLSEF